jgi:hypothetical protein
MKFRFPILFALASFIAALFLVTGCASMKYGHAHAIRLRVVDFQNGEPISGVSATWREDRDDLIYGTAHLGPTDLTPSDSNGEITINAAHEKMVGRIILTHPGYVTMYGVYSGGSLNLSREIQPPPLPQDIFVLDDVQTVTRETDGSYIVKMPK